MRVPRFFCPGLPTAPGAEAILEGEEAHHLARALRLRPGAEVELFDGVGGSARCRLTAVERRRATAEVLERTDRPPPLPFALTCAVAPPKGKRAHRLVEALTELGATRLVPLVTERSQNKLPAGDQAERWALEAAKQCHRDALLQVAPATDLDGLIALARGGSSGRGTLALLADPRGAPPLREVLPPAAPAAVLIAVGPEGGFSETERHRLQEAGFAAARLGRTVLRVETAAAAVAAAVVAAWA